MGLLSKEQIRELIKEKKLVTAQDVQDMLKEMFADTLQEMLEAEVPRDREGEFEPTVVKKRQRDVTGIEEQILALYAKGVTVQPT